MNTPAVRANWFYPLLVWITAVPAGSLLFTLYTAFFVKNNSHGLQGILELLLYMLLGALVLSIFSLGVSYLAFAIAIGTRLKPSSARLLSIIPHVLIILYFGISFLRTDKDNSVTTGVAYILLYFTPLLVFASFFRPHRKN